MRVYELARQLGVKSGEVLLYFEEIGVGGKTASSSVPPVYLGQIRSHFSGEPAAEAAAPTAQPEEQPAEGAQPAAEEEAGAPAEAAAPEAPAEAEEGAEELVRLKVPFTVSEFATALDTDAENVMRAAGELGEEISEEDHVPSELAVLIGEQWGYTVEIEAPEVVEEPEPVEALGEEEEEEKVEAGMVGPRSTQPAEGAGAETAVVEKPQESEAPPMKVVPRRTAPPDAPLRPPVVTVLGHVDHGKTTLLDAIRETNVTADEPGEITQHIGAYQVEVNGKPITFIDTPGHEAFTAMRARGAQVTDIAILVVGADDGVMPQTLEAVDHAEAAGVPIIVGINKVDRPSASPDAVRQRLSERGLVPEEWGGQTIYVELSALERRGIDDLLEMILLVAEMREIRAVRDKPAEGAVLEAELDKRRGPLATLLVQEGVLRQGDSIVAGPIAGKARAMMDDRGNRVKEAGPSTPVQVMGLSGAPEASELFRVVENEREARALAEARKEEERSRQLRAAGPTSMLELSQLFAEGEAKVLNVVLKADTQGTVEAIASSLRPIGTEEVRVNILHTGVGDINESDVSLAAASEPAAVIGFQVGADSQARQLAKDEEIEVRQYQVIYDLLDDVRDTLSGMLEVSYEEVLVGRAEVRATFRSSRVGTIAGCYVTEGRVVRGARARVVRGGQVIHEGPISSMRHVQNDVSEMSEGFECGVVVDGFGDFQEGDTIECVEERELRRAVL